MVFAWSARSATMCGAGAMECVWFRFASIDDGGVGGGSGGGVGGGGSGGGVGGGGIGGGGAGG
eukprot:1612566-Lingulodinium_polyedra.AAC.1